MSGTKVLSGVQLSASLAKDILTKTNALKNLSHITPHLAVIRTGTDIATSKYINLKRTAAINFGMKFTEYQYDMNCTTEEILSKLHELNNDINVQGIIVQLPLPKQVNESLLMSSIHPIKDIDGLNPINIGRLTTMGNELNQILHSKTNKFNIYDQLVNVPCAAISTLYLMDKYNINYTNKNICIFGKSNLIGLPLYLLLLHYNNTIYNIHPLTNNVKLLSKNADIIISAIGQPLYITSHFINEMKKPVVIDIGTNYIEQNKHIRCVGDCDYKSISSLCSGITPVPGGIGPLTINMLMYNTVKAAYIYNNQFELWHTLTNGSFINIENLLVFGNKSCY